MLEQIGSCIGQFDTEARDLRGLLFAVFVGYFLATVAPELTLWVLLVLAGVVALGLRLSEFSDVPDVAADLHRMEIVMRLCMFTGCAALPIAPLREAYGASVPSDYVGFAFFLGVGGVGFLGSILLSYDHDMTAGLFRGCRSLRQYIVCKYVKSTA